MDASHLFPSKQIVPVVAIDHLDHAVPLANCLYEAGFDKLEVTLRTDAALAAMQAISSAVPKMVVGAGSVRTAQQMQAVHDAGALFAVAPGATDALVSAAKALTLAFIPGAATPSEMMVLLQQGYRLQKFFPAEYVGGIALLKAVSAPLPEVNFMPTGGISANTATDYLSLQNVQAVGGSWIAPTALLEKGDFQQIRQLAELAAKLVE